MKLNHINLTVTDVRAAAGFLETYFGMRQMGGNAGMAFVTDDDGFDVAAPERHHAYGFYVEAPAGFTVELGA
jgi:catechol 2,3-dioxygenase-like lactoylglutathione lyase family enzyme